MNLSIKIGPRRFTGRTKSILVSNITTGKCFAVGYKNGIEYSGYTNFMSITEDSVRVFNLVKHRRKAVRNKKGKTIKSTPGYWEAYVYDFPIDLLNVLGLSVKQNNRNFTLYKRK